MQAVSEAIREGASPQELFHAVTAATNLGVEVDVAKVLRATQMALKKDDSVLRSVKLHVCKERNREYMIEGERELKMYEEKS